MTVLNKLKPGLDEKLYERALVEYVLYGANYKLPLLRISVFCGHCKVGRIL